MRKKTKLTYKGVDIKQNGSHSPNPSAWDVGLLPNGLSDVSMNGVTVNRRLLYILLPLVVAAFLVLLVQLFNLQIVQGERMRGIAEGNRVRESVTFAPRGRILDRNGVVLADNTASFQLSVTPYRLPEEKHERQEIYATIGETIDRSAKEVAKVAESKGLDHPQPLLAVEHIPYETALKLEYVLPELTGFSLDAVPMREYKQEAALAHILGYVGRVSEEELEEKPSLNPIDFIGKAGVEVEMDDILRGENGVVETEVDALGRPLRTLREKVAEPGEDIRLTIDYELQKRFAAAVKEQMANAGVNKASGVIIDPRSGEVLAMVSFPSYNNNLFARGISAEEYGRLVNDPLQPMLNRAISGGFPSGSTIKPINLLGALETGTVSESTIIVDTGQIVVGSLYDPSAQFVFRGWDPSGLGPMDARRAIAMSSNIYFYTVAGGQPGFKGMGIDNLVKYYRMFGLGKRTGIDLPNETAGLVPDPQWKKSEIGEDWVLGDTYHLAIGQGNLLVSPLQMARAYSVIVNGGKLLKPHINLEAEPEVLARPKVRAKNYKITQEGMRMTVTGSGTTSPSVFANVPVPVAGKSGTAETDPGVRKSHAWFAAYAPYGSSPEVLSVLLLEEGEGGSQFSAPAIAEAFEWHFRDVRN